MKNSEMRKRSATIQKHPSPYPLRSEGRGTFTDLRISAPAHPPGKGAHLRPKRGTSEVLAAKSDGHSALRSTRTELHRPDHNLSTNRTYSVQIHLARAKHRNRSGDSDKGYRPEEVLEVYL